MFADFFIALFGGTYYLAKYARDKGRANASAAERMTKLQKVKAMRDDYCKR